MCQYKNLWKIPFQTFSKKLLNKKCQNFPDIKRTTNSKKQKLAFQKLRLLGNFQHIRKVFCLPTGELKVARCPSREELEWDPSISPCLNCFGFIRKKDLVTNAKNCQFKLEVNQNKVFKKGQSIITDQSNVSEI